MPKNSRTLKNGSPSTPDWGITNSTKNPFSLFLEMDTRALNDCFDKLPFICWAQSELQTVVYNNRLTKEKFGNCIGRQCYKSIMGKDNVCSCCKTEKILNNNQPDVCHECKQGGNGHTVKTFHNPITMGDGSKYVLKFSIDTVSKTFGRNVGKSQIEMKKLSVTAFRSMCASCKKIKEPKDEWIPVEKYLQNQFGIIISHGICKECMLLLYPEIKM